MVAMDMVVVATDTVLVVMDTVIAVMATVVMVALASRDNGVFMTTATVMVVVAMGIVTIVGFAMMHMRREWSPDHIRASDTGWGEAGGPHGVFVCSVRHIRSDTSVREVSQLGDLVTPRHLI